jgi:hypothetical protein
VKLITPATNKEIKNTYLYTHSLVCFMASCLVKHRDNFIFTSPSNSSLGVLGGVVVKALYSTPDDRGFDTR